MEITEHARMRCAQRQIDANSFAFIKQHGRKIRRTGITFIFLGRRDIPEDLRRDDRFAKLAGTTLLVSPGGQLITTYRNGKALKAIRKKSKHRMRGAAYRMRAVSSVFN